MSRYVRHCTFAILNIFWPDWFVRCCDCCAFEHIKWAHCIVTPGTHFTDEAYDYYCRSCKDQQS